MHIRKHMLSYMGRKGFVRERIIEAAFDCFARQGYEAVSTRDIASAANVGHASMYKHFESKEALGKEVYRTCLQTVLQGFQTIADMKGDALRQVQEVCNLLYTLYDERPRALALVIFPPHEFTPWELAKRNNKSPRSILLTILKKDEWQEAIIWGCISGPLQDRYNKRLKGSMQPRAEIVNVQLKQLMAGTSHA